MIVVEVYNQTGILLDIISNVTDPGAVLNVDFDWEKVGGVQSGTIEISPNYIHNIAVDSELKIYRTDDTKVVTVTTDLIEHVVTAYVTKLPTFKENETLKIHFAGYWRKLDSEAKTDEYLEPITLEKRQGYSAVNAPGPGINWTMQQILEDLYAKNIEPSAIVSSDGLMQLPLDTTTRTIKLTVEIGANVLASTFLRFTTGTSSASSVGQELIAGQTYYINIAELVPGVAFNANYSSDAVQPITDRITDDMSKLVAPDQEVINFITEDMKLTEILSTLVDMANIDYHATQYACYVDKDKVINFEELTIQDYLYEGITFHNPDISEDSPTINRVTLYTKNEEKSNQTVFRGYIDNPDSISKYGIKTRALVFTLEEGAEESELDPTDFSAIIYMAKMLISKNSVPQKEVSIRRLQQYLPHGMYQLVTQAVLQNTTVMEGDELYTDNAENLPGYWNMLELVGTTYELTADNFLYGKYSIKFDLGSFAVGQRARYNFVNTVYGIKSFFVWVYLEGGAEIDVVLSGAIDEVRRTVTTQDQWVRVELTPTGSVNDIIGYMGLAGTDVGEVQMNQELSPLPAGAPGTMAADIGGGLVGMFAGEEDLAKDGCLGIQENTLDAVQNLTVYADDDSGAFLMAANHMWIEFNTAVGNVYVDKAEAIAKSNLAMVESLERQRVEISTVFKNKVNLGARPSSLIDEIEKGAKQGESAYDMYKGVTKTLAP